MKAQVDIAIWSDVVCPWCVIGHGNLMQALAELDGEIAATIRWLPFELNPDMPPEGEEQAAHIARKYHRSESETQQVRDTMREMAQAAGVSLDYAGPIDPPPPAMMWNTRDAHRLLDHALAQHGPERQTRLALALFDAHFRQRRAIGERTVLLDIATDAGLDHAAATQALDNPETARAVADARIQAFDRNITGVPAMVVDGTFLIPGAQAPETYVNALRRIVSRRGGSQPGQQQ